MTTPTHTAAPPAEFVRRADWSDENNYPPDDMVDASAWAWEFLRRNQEYADNHRVWQQAFADVPTRPFDDTPLTHYRCDPPPADPEMPYGAYALAHPKHFVVSIKDHIRLRWGIRALPDPDLSWDKLYRANQEKSFDDNARLQWLFTTSTVEIIRPPSATLADAKRPTFVTAACGSNEVLVRLTLDGAPEDYGKSLTRELAKYFVDGTRNSARRITVYGDVEVIPDPDTGKPIKAIFLDPDDEGGLDSPIIEFQESGWNKLDVRRASLQHILRMADLLADFERGQLVLQTQDRKEEKVSVFIESTIDWQSLSRTLMKHFALGKFFLGKDAGPNDSRAIVKWLSDAEELVCNREYLRLSRANFDSGIRENPTT